MRIITLGDEILCQKAEPVAGLGRGGTGWDENQWKQTAQEMLFALEDGKGVGLAGPQIGLLRRIFVVNVQGDVPRVFINPSII
jgi:peptide deformylase